MPIPLLNWDSSFQIYQENVYGKETTIWSVNWATIINRSVMLGTVVGLADIIAAIWCLK